MRPDYIITMGAFAATILNFVRLRKKAVKRDLWFSSGMLLSGAVFYLMLAMNIPLYSFVEIMGYVFGPIAKPVVHWVTEGAVNHG